MNIKEAKDQIKNAMTAYFSKNEYGSYVIPIEKQRPIFLMGPPGIGKTAIMEQVASELGVGLVSYSMTHHTRQSALGLPFIMQKTYDGKEYSVSEYTMSEIIASVYDMMEETGMKEGILFLDEINCVSETLSPVMLQFLQYKVFGRHSVPAGWIVVTAGNPPEYNNSVHDFDIVTWDRLKRIDVDPDYDVWKEYAYKTNVHPAILTYLDIKKENFYKIETTVDGKSFVTARGWSDLSDMMRLYEKHQIPVNEKLTGQYLQNKKIAKDFSVYYDLFNKYRSDYQVDKILAGNVPENIKQRAKAGKFDERLSLLGLLLDGLTQKFRAIALQEQTLKELLGSLRNVRMALSGPETEPVSALAAQMDSVQLRIKKGKTSSSLSADDEYVLQSVHAVLEEEQKLLSEKTPKDADEAFKLIKSDYDRRNKDLKKQAEDVGKSLSNVFSFCEEVFPDGQEVLILVTELTINTYAARFIGRYGSKEYFAHNKELLFYEREKEIIQEVESLEL